MPLKVTVLDTGTKQQKWYRFLVISKIIKRKFIFIVKKTRSIMLSIFSKDAFRAKAEAITTGMQCF
jgi:hypothetical protein